MTTRRTLLASALAFSATAAFADDGLYEGVFDPTSSFIRVIAPAEVFASVNGVTLRDLDRGVSPYVNVMPGTIPVSMSGGEIELQVDPATHYTVVMTEGADAPVVLTDTITQSPAKADVILYNLSSRNAVELYVPAAKAVAIPDVPSQGGKAVTLKAPLTLDFDLRDRTETLATVTQVGLVRKAGMALVLTETGVGFEAVAVPSTYKR